MSVNDEPNRRVFDTPLSVQRYQWVQKCISEDPTIKSVTDLGCGNGRINIWLKSITHLETINFIDCDKFLLEDQIDYHFQPGIFEMIFGRQNSEKDLSINVFHGDITVPHDQISADCMIMVEVIEHMLMEDVEQVTRALFGYYQPRIAIITTPNSEFNHLLRREGENESKFRHFDHKFEWTRAEFWQWTQEVINNYPYTVRFDGVGHLPGSEPFGPCTQIAVFTRVALTQQLTRDSFLRHNIQTDRIDEKSDATKQNKDLKIIGQYTMPGRKCEVETPNIYDDGFDWGRNECTSDISKGTEQQ